MNTIQTDFAKPSYLTSTWHNLLNAASRAVDALNKTIKLIGEYNLGLIAFSSACAYFHDYNIVLIYILIGGVFYKQVPEIVNSVNAIYQSCFLVTKPIRDYRIFNYKLLNYPLQALIYGSGVFNFLLLKPFSLLFTEAYFCIRCGANLVAASRRIVEKQSV